MRQSKFQRLEQNRKYTTPPEKRLPIKGVMSSSKAQATQPESCTFRLLRRFRNGWGMVMLTVLLSVYLTGFYHHVPFTEGPHNVIREGHAHRSEQPERSYLVLHTSTEYQAALPGSLKSNSKTFEIAKEKKTRDSNTLPGAIGLEGTFDEDSEKPADGQNNEAKPVLNTTEPVPAKRSSGPKEEETESSSKLESSKSASAEEKNPEISPSTKSIESNDMVPTGEEKPPLAVKEKKSRRKRKRKQASLRTTSDPTEGSTEKGIEKTELSEEEAKVEADGKGAVTSIREEANETITAVKQIMIDPDGPRPMNRNMEELQVPADTGVLDEEAVKGYYGKLVKAYLAPFANGIDRKSFFDILRRRTYSMSPPGSNKGVQTILFQLIKQKLFLMDPYEVMKNSKPFYKTRVRELIGLFSDVVKGGNVPDTEFLVAIHDCVQTVNAPHTYRGAVFSESNPTFTIVSCNFSDNIPIPMWEGDVVRGGLRNWDKKMEAYKNSDTIPWAEKQEKAVFRGGNRPSMFFKKKTDADKRCDDAGRSRLSYLGKTNPDLFNVSVSGRCGGMTHVMSSLSESDHHQFKYILYAEGNCFWADRLNKQIFGPSVIIKQETPCGQFWEPLLKPMTHYIPTDFFFQDTVDQINWAKEHDSDVQKIVKNANEFATNFLSQNGIKSYVEVLLTEYTKLLNEKNIEPEQGSKEMAGR